MRDFPELVDAYMDQENLYRDEGRRGVENLCTLVSALGYKDPMYFGQLTSKACLGDLVCFLEDNSGAIKAIYSWIQDREVSEWKEALEEVVKSNKLAIDQYPDGLCPNCAEEINPESHRGDGCDNCGHVFNWDDDDG